MLSKTLNAERIRLWGNPWHGLVADGQLQLPGGGAKAWPQPAGGEDPGLQGMSFLADLGAPAITRTPEEAAGDLAQGHVWTHQALLSGRNQALQQQELHGWIYRHPNGARFWVEPLFNHSSVADLHAPWAGELRVREFGRVSPDGPASPTVLDLALSDLGQGGTDLPVSSGSLLVVDVTPAGDRAIVEIAGSIGYFHRRPVGYLEVSLAADGAGVQASVAVLRTRAETIGAYSETSHDEREALWWWWWDDGALRADPPPTVESYLDKWFYWAGPRGGTKAVTGRILGMRYVDGTPAPITLDVEQSWSAEALEPDLSYDAGTGAVSIAQTASGTLTQIWTLQHGAHTLAVSWSETSTAEASFSNPGEPDSGPEHDEGDLAIEQSWSVESRGMAASSASPKGRVDLLDPEEAFVFTVPANAGVFNADATDRGYWLGTSTDNLIAYDGSFGAPRVCEVRAISWGNHARALFLREDSISDWQDYRIGYLSPSGALPGFAGFGVNADIPYFGAWDPLTGALAAWSPVPVAWI